jgi:hypothetical protein
MSLRYLRFETEHENGMVDERGVLIPGAAGGVTIVEITNGIFDDVTIGDNLYEMVRNGQPLCFFSEDRYIFPLIAYFNTVIETSSSGSVTNYYLAFKYVDKSSDSFKKYEFRISGI